MALDKGHEYADDELKKLEKKLHMEYSKAFREMKKKADVYFNAFKKEDAKQLSNLNEGKITEEQYKRWRMSSMAMGERYTNMVAKLAEDLTNTNKIAMAMIDPTLKSAYAENYNYGGYEIAKGMKMNIAWDLMDVNTVERLIKDDPKVLPKPRVDIPRDRRWNQQKIRSAITQGIMQGEPVNKIANRLKQVTDMSDSAAIRNARTATTGAENAGRQRSYDHAANDLGTEMEKVWVATPDSRTRDSHRMLDLETVPYNESFSNGLMYPGDSSGEPQEVYNCRCTMIGKPKYFKYDFSDRYSKLGDMSYEEWKRGQSYQREESYESKGNHVVAEGSDISSTWKRRSDKFDFEIDDIIDAQGFNGLPRIVNADEFDEYVKESNMIAVRGYTAPDEETLKAYQDQLYNGKWYIDCSNGGAMHGQGMYTAGNYGVELGERALQTASTYSQGIGTVETITLDKSAKIVTEKELQDIKNEMQYTFTKQMLNKNLTDEQDLLLRAMTNVTSLSSEQVAKAYQIESNIRDDMIKSVSELLPKTIEKIQSLPTDQGQLAALFGYDALEVDLNSSKNDVYFVILNRTKCIIKGK